MKSIIKDFAKICYVLLFLISANVLSQESPSFTITPEITKTVAEKYQTGYPDVFSVLLKDVEYKISDTSKTSLKRKTFIVVNPSIDSDSLNGKFIKLNGEYRVALENINQQCIIDEIINDTLKVASTYYNRQKMSKCYQLIQKVSTSQYYYIMTENFISSVMKYQRVNELLSIIHKLGYKEYNNPNDSYDENLYIKSKTCEIKLDNWTYTELKQNPSYITALDNHQMKLDALIKQTVIHSKTLDKYLGLYSIQRNKMSTANITAWRAATAQAQKLGNQIVALNEKYAGNYSFTPLSKLSNTQYVFFDNLGASKGVLRM